MDNFKLVLRLATSKDAQILFQWRNDPITRQFSHDQRKIDFESHCAWLEKSLKNPDRKIYIALLDQRPVGTVRADSRENVTELSWTVDPNYRGQGIGTMMVSLLADSIKGPIKAEIKNTNKASIHIAESCRFNLVETHHGVMFYYRGLTMSNFCPLCNRKAHFTFSLKKYNYYRCEYCKTLFVANLPDIEEIHKGYSESYFEASSAGAEADKERRGYSSYMDSQESLRRSFSRKLNVVLKHVKSGNLLEVGAAYGTFMALANQHFSCVGLELSQYAAQVAREKFGADVRQGSIEEGTCFTRESFDVIVMWDVIEHLADPTKSLQEVYKLLKPGGQLFISTDDANNWLPRMLGKHWWGLAAPLHLCHFSKKGMACVLVRTGDYEIIKHYADWRNYGISEIISHFGVSYKNKALIKIGKSLSQTSIGKIEIPVARPEQFITFAQKKKNEK